MIEIDQFFDIPHCVATHTSAYFSNHLSFVEGWEMYTWWIKYDTALNHQTSETSVNNITVTQNACSLNIRVSFSETKGKKNPHTNLCFFFFS